MRLRKLPAFRHLWIIAIALLSTAGLVLILTQIEPFQQRLRFWFAEVPYFFNCGFHSAHGVILLKSSHSGNSRPTSCTVAPLFLLG